MLFGKKERDPNRRSNRRPSTHLLAFSFRDDCAGERGVQPRFTAVTGKVFGEYLYFRIPLIESVQMIDVKVQKYEMKSDVASKDHQTVHSVVALNFHIDPDRVANIYQDAGLQFKDRIIGPAMQEAIKALLAW